MNPYHCWNGCCGGPPAMPPPGHPLPLPYAWQGGQYLPHPPQPSQVVMMDPSSFTLYGDPSLMQPVAPVTAGPPVQQLGPQGSYYMVHHPPTHQPPFVMTTGMTMTPGPAPMQQPAPPLPLPLVPNSVPASQYQPLFGSGNASSVEINFIDIPLPAAPGYHNPTIVTVPIPAHAYPPQATAHGRAPLPKEMPGAGGSISQVSYSPQPTSRSSSNRGQAPSGTWSEEDLIDFGEDLEAIPGARAQGETGNGGGRRSRGENGQRQPAEPSPSRNPKKAPPIPWKAQQNWTQAELGEIKRNACKFCLSNNETLKFCSSHKVYDQEGNVTCPILRRHICQGCGATGDAAHTLKYCPSQPRRPQRDNNRGMYDCVRNAGGGYSIRKY